MCKWEEIGSRLREKNGGSKPHSKIREANSHFPARRSRMISFREFRPFFPSDPIATQERAPWLYLKAEPIFDGLREETQFKDLVAAWDCRSDATSDIPSAKEPKPTT